MPPPQAQTSPVHDKIVADTRQATVTNSGEFCLPVVLVHPTVNAPFLLEQPTEVVLAQCNITLQSTVPLKAFSLVMT